MPRIENWLNYCEDRRNCDKIRKRVDGTRFCQMALCDHAYSTAYGRKKDELRPETQNSLQYEDLTQNLENVGLVIFYSTFPMNMKAFMII